MAPIVQALCVLLFWGSLTVEKAYLVRVLQEVTQAYLKLADTTCKWTLSYRPQATRQGDVLPRRANHAIFGIGAGRMRWAVRGNVILGFEVTPVSHDSICSNLNPSPSPTLSFWGHVRVCCMTYEDGTELDSTVLLEPKHATHHVWFIRVRSVVLFELQMLVVIFWTLEH